MREVNGPDHVIVSTLLLVIGLSVSRPSLGVLDSASLGESCCEKARVSRFRAASFLCDLMRVTSEEIQEIINGLRWYRVRSRSE